MNEFNITREQIQVTIETIKAYHKDKTTEIQYWNNVHKMWEDVVEPNFRHTSQVYRIKPTKDWNVLIGKIVAHRGTGYKSMVTGVTLAHIYLGAGPVNINDFEQHYEVIET